MQTFLSLPSSLREKGVAGYKKQFSGALSGLLLVATMVFFIACTTSGTGIPDVDKNRQDAALESTRDGSLAKKDALIKRGKYLMIIGACHDCHTPKVMTPNGPELDSIRLLSGHPSGELLPPVVSTQDWVLFSQGLTAFVGPWGISYAANLTPDVTGTGRWTFEQFETAIRKGNQRAWRGVATCYHPCHGRCTKR